MPAHKQGATRVFQAAVELECLTFWVNYVWNGSFSTPFSYRNANVLTFRGKMLSTTSGSILASPPSQKAMARQLGFQPCGTKCHHLSCHLLPWADTVLPACAMQASLGSESKPHENGCWASWSGHPARRALLNAELPTWSRAAPAEQLGSTLALFRLMVLWGEHTGSWGLGWSQTWRNGNPAWHLQKLVISVYAF